MTLLATKLHPPVFHRRPIPRADLNRRLNAGLEAGHPVVLISAPAGFGKTTCVHQAPDAYQPALQAFTRAIQHGRTAGNTLTEMLSTSGLAQMAFERGQLHLAHEITTAAFPTQQANTAPPIPAGFAESFEPLTAPEVQVLSLMALSGFAKNRPIK